MGAEKAGVGKEGLGVGGMGEVKGVGPLLQAQPLISTEQLFN